MIRCVVTLGLLSVLVTPTGSAQLQEVRQTIFGMD